MFCVSPGEVCFFLDGDGGGEVGELGRWGKGREQEGI